MLGLASYGLVDASVSGGGVTLCLVLVLTATIEATLGYCAVRLYLAHPQWRKGKC